MGCAPSTTGTQKKEEPEPALIQLVFSDHETDRSVDIRSPYTSSMTGTGGTLSKGEASLKSFAGASNTMIVSGVESSAPTNPEEDTNPIGCYAFKPILSASGSLCDDEN